MQCMSSVAQGPQFSDPATRRVDCNQNAMAGFATERG